MGGRLLGFQWRCFRWTYSVVRRLDSNAYKIYLEFSVQSKTTFAHQFVPLFSLVICRNRLRNLFFGRFRLVAERFNYYYSHRFHCQFFFTINVSLCQNVNCVCRSSLGGGAVGHYFYKNKQNSSFTTVLSIRISFQSSHLLILYIGRFSTSIWLLPFSVNVWKDSWLKRQIWHYLCYIKYI